MGCFVSDIGYFPIEGAHFPSRGFAQQWCDIVACSTRFVDNSLPIRISENLKALTRTYDRLTRP
jgi:hypothetical protein